MASICGSPVCAGGKPQLKFTYTGDYVVRKDGVVELLTSGTIVFLEPKVIDVFLVGGGASGRSPHGGDAVGYGGGGGGYTRTIKRVNVSINTQYPVVIGTGGTPTSGTSINGNPGGSSSFDTFTVNGGTITPSTPSYIGTGYNGGSGGGGGVSSNSDYGTGGSDGNNGEHGYPTYTIGGYGQGFTTREFGEVGGKLYAGGGGGGRYMHAQSPVTSMGGPGGGGTGGWSGNSADGKQEAAAGVANTGGGGGGGAYGYFSVQAASGGSGIVCFRDAQELPELAGTWVLNERLYAPESDVYFNNQVFKNGDASNPNRGNGINLSCTTSKIWYTSYPSGDDVTVYTFSSNSWGSDKLNYMTFPAGATASDEFRAWLASNASKQA